MGASIYLSDEQQRLIIAAIRNHNLGLMDELNTERTQRDKTRKKVLVKEVNECEQILHKMGVQW